MTQSNELQTGTAHTTLFREAMASFPSGVTIVTTADANGRWWGFTATSFCSVSMDPPLVLVCLANTAECYPVFAAVEGWMVHVIHPGHTDLALRFATRGANKFVDDQFRPDAHGMPVLDAASVALHCSTHAKHHAGDHVILVGRVEAVELDRAQQPAVYFRRAFHDVLPG
jgi:flavin reductase ActVB